MKYLFIGLDVSVAAIVIVGVVSPGALAALFCLGLAIPVGWLMYLALRWIVLGVYYALHSAIHPHRDYKDYLGL